MIESPIIHAFDASLAARFSIEEAIFIQHIQHWINRNRGQGTNFHEGRTWTYNSVRAYAEIFPYWTEKQVRSIIEKLVQRGVLIEGNFNEQQWDRTKWYAFSDEEQWLPNPVKSHLPKRANGSAQTGKPICPNGQITNTCTVPSTNTVRESGAKAPATELEAIASAADQETAKEKATPKNLEACHAYGREIDLPPEQVEGFYDYYTSNGWKVSGRAPMKDWRASMRRWKRNSFDFSPHRGRNGNVHLVPNHDAGF